jgi:hypothetical protein
MRVAALSPTQLPQSLLNSADTSLSFWIGFGIRHQHADAHPVRLLRARRQRPRGCRAAQCEYEFSPSDVDCHATPPAGGRVHAIDGTISRFSQGTNNAFALRKS